MQSSEILADIFISTRMRAALEAVPFEIEAEEPGLSPPCPLRYQLAFMQPEQILCLQFRNYYVATVTLEAQVHDGKSSKGETHHNSNEGSSDKSRSPEPPWQLLVANVSLMHSPHFENDAQKWHRLFVSPAAAAYVENLESNTCSKIGGTGRLLPSLQAVPRIKKLRLTLAQPSPSWLSCRLEQLSCFIAISITKSAAGLAADRAAAAAAAQLETMSGRGLPTSTESATPLPFDQSMQELILSAATLRRHLAPPTAVAAGGGKANESDMQDAESAAQLPVMLGLGSDVHVGFAADSRQPGLASMQESPSESADSRRPSDWPQKALLPS